MLGLVLCVVCFFKQRTAYEMRISDWSSDVCSSDLDLVAGVAGPDQVEHLLQLGGQAVGDAHVLHRAALEHLVDEDLERLAPGAGLAGLLHDELGRASGRERVCQYL